MDIIRKATKDDVYDILKINVDSYLTTYDGIIPKKILKDRIVTLDSRAEKFRKVLSSDNDNRVYRYVLEIDGKIVGNITIGPTEILIISIAEKFIHYIY